MHLFCLTRLVHTLFSLFSSLPCTYTITRTIIIRVMGTGDNSRAVNLYPSQNVRLGPQTIALQLYIHQPTRSNRLHFCLTLKWRTRKKTFVQRFPRIPPTMLSVYQPFFISVAISTSHRLHFFKLVSTH